MRSQTWSVTDRDLTLPERFIKPAPPSRTERAFLYWVTELPFGKALRQHVYDWWVLSDEPVVLRNHEASYDVISLEPSSRVDSTYVLQEYFVARLAVAPTHRVSPEHQRVHHVLPEPAASGQLGHGPEDEAIQPV